MTSNNQDSDEQEVYSLDRQVSLQAMGPRWNTHQLFITTKDRMKGQIDQIIGNQRHCPLPHGGAIWLLLKATLGSNRGWQQSMGNFH